MKRILLVLVMFTLVLTIAGCTDEPNVKDNDILECAEGQSIEGGVCVDDVVDVCTAPKEVIDGVCRDLTEADCADDEIFVLGYCIIDPNPRPIPGGEVPVEEVVCRAQDYEYDYDSLIYDMVWNDEFDGTTLDLEKWVYEINGGGGGNNELQYYTDQNTQVSDGTLKITAKREDYNGWDYTSSRITTKNSSTFRYGIFEARIKLPPARGTWSAFWMMPKDSVFGTWPDSGEIDIMEHVGYDNNVVHSTIHTERFNHPIRTQKGRAYNALSTITSEFHTYKLEWLPDKLIFSVDDVEFFTYNPTSYNFCPTSEEWPFGKDFFMILNVAVGGDWGGAEGIAEQSFPASMEVDYVRVYQSELITNLQRTTNEAN
mgnify:FL=1